MRPRRLRHAPSAKFTIVPIKLLKTIAHCHNLAPSARLTHLEPNFVANERETFSTIFNFILFLVGTKII